MSALDEVERSRAQVLIITGAGKAFCAGLDLDELKGLLGKTHEENLKDSAFMAQMFRRIYEFPLPTIAAVNGAAIAGGTGIATMCDFTLAVPEAKFGYTEVKIGFVPGDRLLHPRLAGRPQDRARPADDRPPVRRRRGAPLRAGERSRRARAA